MTHLRLEGLQSWDFSTGELFNPSLCSCFFSCITSIANCAFRALFRMDLSYTPAIFLNVTSLDLSDSIIGDYGVKCFVSHFKNLKVLDISSNNIGYNAIGEIDIIFNNKNLTSLNIRKNHFSNHSQNK